MRRARGRERGAGRTWVAVLPETYVSPAAQFGATPNWPAASVAMARPAAEVTDPVRPLPLRSVTKAEAEALAEASYQA